MLFKRIDSDHRIYTIHPRACVRGESNSYFRFIGRLLAKAVHDVQLVDLPWAHLLYKHILGQKVGLDELAEMDEVCRWLPCDVCVWLWLCGCGCGCVAVAVWLCGGVCVAVAVSAWLCVWLWIAS